MHSLKIVANNYRFLDRRPGCEVEILRLVARLTSKSKSLDTPPSALTGRHQPAAREHSHLFGLSRVRFAPSFSLVSAGHRRFMKGGRNDHFEVSSAASLSRVSP